MTGTEHWFVWVCSDGVLSLFCLHHPLSCFLGFSKSHPVPCTPISSQAADSLCHSQSALEAQFYPKSGLCLSCLLPHKMPAPLHPRRVPLLHNGLSSLVHHMGPISRHGHVGPWKQVRARHLETGGSASCTEQFISCPSPLLRTP